MTSKRSVSAWARVGFLLLVYPDHAGMDVVAGLVSEGKAPPVLAAQLPLERAAQAHGLGESGHTSREIVLTVNKEQSPRT